MIKYFKLYDPFRLIGLFLLLLLFRAAWLWQLHPLSLPDLYHMLIGEKLGGGFMLYAELKDNMPPLSALVYYLIDLGFGRSPLAYQILSLILLFFQAIIFNGLLADNRAFKELSNLSALAYILLGCSIFGFSSLSPALIALTFALGATQKLFYVIQHKAGRDALFSLGFLLSLSMLSDQHALILLLIFSFCIVFYSDVNTSQFFLFLIGFLFPLVLVGLYFFWFDGLEESITYFFTEVISIDLITNLKRFSLNWELLLPTALVAWGVLNFIGKRGQNLPQQRFLRIMMLWLFVSLISILFSPDPFSSAAFLYALVPSAYFVGGYFVSARRRWLAEICALLLFVNAIAISAYPLLLSYELPVSVIWQDLQVDKNKVQKAWEGKSILIIDEDFSAYQNAKIGSVYVNRKITLRELRDTDTYKGVEKINHAFSLELPEIIYDPHDLMPAIFERIPSLKFQFKRDLENTWVLK